MPGLFYARCASAPGVGHFFRTVLPEKVSDTGLLIRSWHGVRKPVSDTMKPVSDTSALRPPATSLAAN
jgi:hypothetical protein